MGNIIHQHYCCYKNADEQNLDKISRVIYINNGLKVKENNTVEIEKIIENDTIKKEEESKINIKENKPSAISTALVSKKNSSKNIIQITKPKDEKYIESQIIINDIDFINQVEKIQRAFREKIKKKPENEKLDSNKYLNIETSNNNEILDKRFSGTYCDDLYKTSEIEKDLKVSDEYPILYTTYSHNNFNNNNNTLKKLNYSFAKSSTIKDISYHFINEITELSFLQKGNFITKNKKYKFYGYHNLKGRKEGFGIIKWEDGSTLKANFIDSKINGYASFYDKNTNSFFSGYYKNNCPKGFGIYNKDNVKIIGDSWFKNNVKNLGIEIWFDDNYYQGEFKKSIKNGIGLYRWPDGTLYFGEWKNNKMDGYGLIKYSNDSIYFGEYKNGLMNGWGEFLWSDLKYYCGNYKNDIKDGFGIFVWNFFNLNAYVGFWENGKQNGIGIQLFNNKEKIGFFNNGRRTLILNGPWEIRDYLKSEQFRYQKFLEMNSKNLKKFVFGLKNNEILKEYSIGFN